MKTILVLAAAALFGTQAFASPSAGSGQAKLSCKEIQELEGKGVTFVRSAYDSDLAYSLTRQVAQLRRTLILQKAASPAEIRKASVSKLDRMADGAKFSTITLGDRRFQAVDIAQGDNPFEYFFNFDTNDFSGIALLDGSLQVNGSWCEIKNTDF